MTSPTNADVIRTGSNEPDHSANESIVGSILVAAFGSAAMVAVVALVVSAPPLRVGAVVAGPVLLLVWLGAAVLGARRIPSRRRVLWSSIAGVLTASLLMLFLGSLLTKPQVASATEAAESQAVASVRPEAPLLVAGFLGLGAVVGAVAGTMPRLLAPAKPTTWPWPARLALITAGATLPLLLLGGLVTSTESGMAVPDWPGSYGLSMVLFPVGLMADPRIFLEHSHRLFGALVGASTIATACSVQWARPPTLRISKVVAWVAVVLVVVQGVLGGTRVTENSPALAVGHGILGQVFFMTLAALVATLVPSWSTRSPTTPGIAKLARVLLGMLLVQLAFGAVFRHLGTRGVHALYSHIALALVIVILAPILGAKLSRAAGQGSAPAACRRIGKAISHSTALQFFLGFGALAGAIMGGDRGPVPLHTQLETAPSVPLWEVALTTLHQANGAILLVMTGLAVAWTLRPRPSLPTGA